MIEFPSDVKIYMCLEMTDMRRSFDRLSGMVKEYLGHDPLSGHLFVFRNKSADKIKVLYWDKDGYALWYKRLKKGTFIIPPGLKNDYEMTSEMFQKLLEGFHTYKKRKRL